MSSNYARLRACEFDMDEREFINVITGGRFFEDKMQTGEVLDGGAPEGERAPQQQKTIPDHMYFAPSKIPKPPKPQDTKGCTDNFLVQQQRAPSPQQNIENGNPNISGRGDTTTTLASAAAILSHSSTASGASLQEQGVLSRTGASLSGRWTERSQADHNGRWKAAERESYEREDAAGEDCTVPNPLVPKPPSSGNGQWASAPGNVQRVATYHDVAAEQQQETCSAERAHKSQQSQSQHSLQPCALQSSCNDVRHTHRFAKDAPLVPSPVQEEENSNTTTELEKKFQAMSDGEYGGCFTQERPCPGMHRSASTRDGGSRPRNEVTIENWRHQSANKSAHQPGTCGVDGRHRVSFTLNESSNHGLERHKQQREQWGDIPMPHSRKVTSGRNHPDHGQPSRYDYEQPAFVDRERQEDHSGKTYTSYGLVNGTKETTKVSSGRQHSHLPRAFSHRDQSSNYMRISRTFSVNSAASTNLSMECVSCGTGMGIVVLGFPENECSFCQTCKPKKKKGILAYCKKVLKLSKKAV